MMSKGIVWSLRSSRIAATLSHTRAILLPALTALSLIASANATWAGTLAYWRFEGDGTAPPVAGTTQVEDTNGRTVTNTGVGMRVPDVSGNGNTVWAWEHAFAGETYQSDVPAATVPSTGAPNGFSVRNAGSFPAMFTWSRQSLPTSDVEAIKPLAWTIEASIKSTDISGNRTFVGRDGNRDTGASDANRAPLYFKTLNGVLQILFTDEAGNTYDLSDTTGAITANTWYNVAAVSDGTTLSLYRDSGAGYLLVNSMALTPGDTRLNYDDNGSTTAGDAQWGWTIGRGRYGGSDLQGDAHVDRWFGLIDEVRISNMALTTGQMLFSQVPEPASLALLGMGLSALLVRRRK